MPNDRREALAETLQVLLPWGTPLAERDDGFGGPAFWLAGGASLLLWTAVALLLTTV
jgi:hypothetical protein